MKKGWLLLMCMAVFCLSSVRAEAFLCNGKDLKCLAGWILPDNQVNTPKTNEWASSHGMVTGSGNVIKFYLQFDEQSLETLGYQYNWYSPQNFLFKNFGLEVDICDPSDTLRFDSVKSNFPSAARPTRDTDLSDSINSSCSNAMGLLLRNPGAIVPGVMYEVDFFLKDQLPSDGVVITPYLQISADTHLLAYASYAAGTTPLFDEHLLGGYLDKFEYFAVESENYKRGWMVYKGCAILI